MGRVRNDMNSYSSRAIDIDILYYGFDVINNDDLIIPHPRLQDRKFTLLPLSEIAGSFIHPVFHLTNKELLEKTSDRGKVWLYKD